jgi:hypothetical protein
MLNQRSFSELFEELHSEKEPQETNSTSAEKISAGWESLLEPSHLAFLMGQISRMAPPSPHSQRAYPARIRPDHLLNDEQKLAFESLQSYAPHLKLNFNTRDLRSAYRSGVLKTHPDQGGTAETFQAVKNSYHILFAFVTNEE